MRIPWLLGFNFLLVRVLFADPLPVLDAENQTSGVVLHLKTGAIQLSVCGDRTFHVIYSQDGTFPAGPTGFAVVTEPPPGRFTVADDANAVTLKTERCGIRVDRHTGALTFLDGGGEPFLQDIADGGKSLTPAHVGGIDTKTVDQKFVLDPAEGIFGLGQHPTGVMNYVGTTVHLEQKNTDTAVPVLVSSKGYGVFWNNPAITDVAISPSSQANPTVEWKSEAGTKVDYYVFYGPALDQVVADYRELTGPAPMFGRWAWGFWQCKEHYATQQELLDVAARYRQMQVPIDGIIQDWYYWVPHPWGSHQFDANRYPDPAALTKALHAEAVHIIISVWGKFAPGSSNVEALERAGDLLGSPVPDAEKKEQYYDPFNPAARALYWGQMNRELFVDGFDGWWLDASEPELNTHWGEFRDYKTAAGPGVEVYNAYPLEHTTAVYKGMRAADPKKRVFILTRSAYAGQQRNAAVTWSGDIQGTWDVFAKQIPDGLNFTYSGIPCWNTDTGGFFGHDPKDPAYAELFTRWYQFSAFCPMFRVHGTNKPKEMWRFTAPTEKILIDYDRLRYHLLPYIYSVAWMVTHDNYTMMRGLVMDFPHDPKVFTIPDQYMFGPALMVNPVTRPTSSPSRNVYLPAQSEWVDFWTGENVKGGQMIEASAPIERLPLYVRAGSIIPYGPDVQNAMVPEDPIELRVYRGADGTFTLYEDENDNYNYEKGVLATIPFAWDEKKQMLTIGARNGHFPGMLGRRTFRVVWVSPGHGAGLDSTSNADVEVTYTGALVRIPFHRRGLVGSALNPDF